MQRFLCALELLALAATVALAVLWIAQPSINWEPWIVVCGAATVVVEIYRRNVDPGDESAHATEIGSDDPSVPDYTKDGTAWKDRISTIRAAKYSDRQLSLPEATNVALEGFGIHAKQIRTTGGSTGVRIWVSHPHKDSLLGKLHDEIVSLYGIPVGMDVLDYMTEQTFYRSRRPPLVK